MKRYDIKNIWLRTLDGTVEAKNKKDAIKRIKEMIRWNEFKLDVEECH